MITQRLSNSTPLDFIAGGGEMGALIRAHDWSLSSLGPPQAWPQSLRTAVRLLLNTGHPMYIFWGKAGACLYNDAYRQSIGPERHPASLGRPVREVWAEIWDVIGPEVERVMAGLSATWNVNRLIPITRNGRREDVYWTYSYGPIDDATAPNGIGGVLVVCTETTGTVLAEQRRAQETVRQRRLFERAPGFIAILRGPDHIFEFVNDAYSRMTGGRDYVGRSLRQAFPDLSGQGFFDLLDDVYASGRRFVAHGRPVRFQKSLDTAPEERFLDFIYEPMVGEDDKVTGIFVEGHDVTEARMAILALSVAERRQASLVELSDRFRILDDPADISYAAAEILGRALGVGRAGYGTIDPVAETVTIERDWNAPGIASLAGVLKFRDYGSYVENLKRGETVACADADADPRTARRAHALKAIGAQAFVNMPIIEEGDTVALLYLNHPSARAWCAEELAFIRDVAERTRTAVERRRAEQELRDLAASLERQVAERTAEYDRVWRHSRDLLVVIGADGIFRAISPSWREVLGHDPENVVGHSFLDFIYPDDAEITQGGLDTAASGRDLTNFENRQVHKDGTPRWISWHTSAERDLVYAYGRDITAEKAAQAELTQAQEALRQSQKLEAMGQLTGGVAHDFNNLLTPIIGSLDMLQRRRVGTEREQRLIGGALQSAERAKTLVQRLLAFARRQPLQPTAVDVSLLVNGMAGLVASTSGPQISVAVDAPGDLPAASADPNQLEMAVLNLSVNARDAMPEGGTLRISASAETIGTGHRSQLRPGSYVLISVADTGIGMDEETLAHAVEPFFSTKGIGKGTGLGLSMVHGLALQLGGTLTIWSKPGLGTNVELWLPVSIQSAPEHHGAQSSERKGGMIGTVLLVDDEELVRISTADMLTELGFEVLEANSAEEALKLIDRGASIDLLVTDHLMPGMTGVDLVHAVRERQPATPGLIISGFAEVEGIAPDLPRLTKPYRQADLAASVASLIASSGH
ncbi:MAG: sensory box histidine kinase/response regulator [Rhodospirillales bacterium]|nr:sensory box histidine kinase/response regulator [Rhodospirillales bacterium]